MDTVDFLGLPPWVLSVDYSQIPPMPEDRQRTRGRIGPIVAGMKAGVIDPRNLTENIAELAECLKAEGNELFKEKEYFQAYDVYTTGIVILVKRRERDMQILEVLLTNRACSLLKMDFFKACVNDCTMALSLSSQNLKALYRKALALKSIGDYKGAKTTAEDGQRKALEQNRKTDVKEFEELLCEIKCHPEAVVQNFKENDVTDIPADPVLSDERQKWWDNFNLIQTVGWDHATVSMMTADKLLTLMVGMEKEARTMMGERSYRVADNLFSSVLRIAKHVEVVNLMETNKVLISDIFLQRALCALKMDDYGRAVEYCDMALQLKKDNVEALYRKAVVLKTRRDFSGALTAAMDGCSKAAGRNNSGLFKLCDVLRREIESHLKEVDSEVGSTAFGNSSPQATNPSKVNGESAELGESISQGTMPNKAKKRWKKKAPLATEPVEKEEKMEEDGESTAHYSILYKRDQTISDGAVLKPTSSSGKGDRNEKGDPSAEGDLKGRTVLRPDSSSMKGDLNEKGDLKGGAVLKPISSSEKGNLSMKGDLKDGGGTADYCILYKRDQTISDRAMLKPTSSSEKGDLSTKGDPEESKPVPQKTSVAQQPARPAPPASLNQPPGSTMKSPVVTGTSSGVLNQMANTVRVTSTGLESVATASKDAKSGPQSGALNQAANVKSTAAQASPVSSGAALSQPANSATVKSATVTSISSAVLNQTATTITAKSTVATASPVTAGSVNVQTKPMKVKSSADLEPSISSAVLSQPTKTTNLNSSADRQPPVSSASSNQPAQIISAKSAASESCIKPTASTPSPQPTKIATSKSTTVVTQPSPQPSKPTAVSSNSQQSIPSVVNSASNLAPIKPALLPKNLSEFGKPQVFSDAVRSTAQPIKPLLGPASSLSSVGSDQQRADENADESVPTTAKKKKKKSKARAASPAVGDVSSKPLNPLPPPPFPLHETCNFRLACVQCFKENSPPLAVAHKCCEDIFIVQNRKTQRWVVVRECNTQVRMGGGYVMCWQIIAGSQCPRGSACTFAHNTEELKLWNLQKRGNFRVDEFIANNRSPGNLSSYTVEIVYKKYEGELRMICGFCWKEKKLIMTQDLSQPKCNKGVHDLRLSRLLAHRSKDLRVTMIGKRPFPSKKAFFNMCYQKQFCRKSLGCINAHSEVECDIWYVERDTGLKQEQIIVEWYKIKDKDKPAFVYSNPSSEKPSQPTSSTDECPYKLAKACDLCFNKGRVDVNTMNSERCSSGHVWNLNVTFVILPLKKVIKRLPFHIPWNNNFAICRFVNNCYQGNACQFAHSNEEIHLWKWMVTNKVKTLEAAMQKQPKQASRLVRTLSSASLDERRSSTTSEPAWNVPTPTVVSSLLGQDESFYCCYCSQVCNSQTQLEAHCSSSRHVLNVNSDRDRQWNFHQPPWNVVNGNYKLCIRHLDKKCRYSNVPQANNLCTYAHSQEELDEWIERYKWRAMKRKIAIDENLFSYMDRLLEEYNNSGNNVLSETLNGVRVTCSSQLSYISEDKNGEKTWKFQVESPGLVMKKVALLYHESRLHFTLDGIQNRGTQISSGEDFKAGDQVYNVAVRFRGGLFGSFKQWVVFDFGQRPVLVQKLSVDLGLREIQQKVKDLRKNLHLDRWTQQNRAIVKYPDDLRVVDEFNLKLVAEYKVPTSAEIMQQVIGHELNQHNYKFKMHSLIDLEELTQTRIISGYNVVSMVRVQNCVGDELAGFRFSQGGQLFAQVPLKNQLIEGSLISSSVQSVLLAPTKDQTNRVFEAVLAEMDKRTLQGSDFITLNLSPQCCQDLALKHDIEKQMEIQFQINRDLFCQMHYAIDEMQNVEIIFPDIRKIHLTVGERYQLNFSTSKLNDDQKVILSYVSSRRQHFPPPLVVYGPFGTGKTETMAEAAILLATNNSDVRILICTKTNQAADEYILRHFDPHVSRSDTPKMSFLRVYHKLRKVNTIDPKARKYSLLSSDGSSFRDPTKDDILRNQIVVTTLITSLVITELKLRGQFTHIFIDEAAQVNECHAVIPLCLANDKTCIVLAGDHIQMADPIYSKEAKDQNFHLSLVERLMSLYDSTPSDPIRTPKVLLKANYRNHPEIIKFVAQVFYGGEDSLKAKSVQANVAEFPPLAFYAANGQEVQDSNSTSYYNEAEIMEVVEQVNRVLEKWPVEWGEKQADQILVTTPYTDQVNRIRSQMRLHRNRQLKSVVVLRVQNVPGREFRAVFISTVRTRHLIENCSCLEETEDNDYGFLSDCKILNSAFTRAKSFLAVVGDPVALCSIGSCSKIWHQYFKYCGQRLGGINPAQLNLNAIRMQCEAFLDGLELPRRRTGTADENDENEMENPEPFDMKSLLDLEDWNRDYQLEPDDIIRQLVREGMEGSESVPSTGMGFLEDDAIRSENIRVQEREGHILVSYRGNEAQRARVRLNDQNCDEEYDSVSDEDNEMDAVFDSAEPKSLLSLLKRQPEKYKRCKINIDSTKNIFARPLDKPCRFKRIKVASRRLCGCAFTGDEVVIEILRADESEVAKDKERVAFGQVIGILKQVMNPKYRLFVCTVEEGNTGMMVPINKGIPKIYNLELKSRPKTRSNQVAVYRFLTGGRIQFHRYENVNEFDAVSKVFVVRYLKWDPKFPSPLGIVVQVIPPGTSIDEAMVILNIEHDIPRRFKTETEQEVEELFRAGYTLPNAALKGRVDYRGKVALTIDASESKDLDDALSFEQISSNRFQVVVHISDVSYFLDQATRIDEEARQRGSSFYQAAGEPIHMLPRRLSSDLCSLLPNQDRLTMSVFFTINEAAEILNVEVKRCIIRSKLRLNYEVVEAIVSGNLSDLNVTLPEELVFKLLMLHRIAQKWRQNRLGNLASYHSIEPKWLKGAKAHLLVEEFMVAANHQVAVLLMKKFPLETPLRNQLAPNELELEEWRQRFSRAARNTIALTWPFKSKGEVCRCLGMCKCVPVAPNDSEEMELTKPILESINTAFSEDDMDFLRTLIVSPEYHPQLSIALLYLQFLSDKSQYVCSGDIPEEEQSHFSLNLSAYTHFTSPIRRYLDVVVHRMLGALIDDRASVYTKKQVSDVCLECTDASRRAAKFEEASRLVHVCQLLKEKPIVVFPVVETIDSNGFQLACPTLRHLLRSKLRVRSAWLQPSDKPKVEPDNHQMLLKWSQRIYDASVESSERNIRLPKDGELNPDKHIVKVNSSCWRELLVVIMNETEILKIEPKVSALLKSAKNPSGVAGFEDEVLTSEGLLVRTDKHFCDFSMQFRESGVVRVQLSVELSRGLLVPNIQLLSLNRSCEMCTEHRSDAVACFASKNARKATRTHYGSVYEYQDLWLPVLAIEAASSAVSNDIPATIHNVPIAWHEENSSRGLAYVGIFKLGARFCQDRYLKFPLSSRQVDERANSRYGVDEEACSGYFCVRYAKIKTSAPNTELDLTGVDEVDEPYTWVGHCVMSQASRDEDNTTITIKLRLNSNSKLPRELLGRQNSELATVEWISKPLPDWRMEVAVNGLDEAENLAVCIALGHNPRSFDLFYLEMVKRWQDREVPGQNVANVTQRNAIKYSMTQPFSLIQGPPGTGKTVVAVQLAYLFRKVNDTLPDGFNNKGVHPQVMCCGPSNKSVDVIAGHLMRMKIPDTLIIRVYSQKVEKEDYPIPRNLLLIKKKYKLEDKVRDSELRQISLHHMIREDKWNSNASFLRRMDERIQENPDDVTDTEIEEYRDAIKGAESNLLKLADIILLTCSTSGSPRYKIYGVNVFQLIIDECGMCMEPESLIPIVASKAKQVILLGDHQQLQPIVLESRARKRGLGQSMFERYAKTARMLTVQYRMHEAIAEFPSQQFYFGKLTVGKEEQSRPSGLPFWPAGGSKPIALVHCVGKEEALAVDTEEGGEQSKSNIVEINYAVFVVRQLVEKYHVAAKSIAVLSQYRAQSTQISKKLLACSTLKEVTAQTVVAAQGSEWDYVVLSTVRSLPEIEIERRPSLTWKRKHLGFVADSHQINVAITRAKKGLIIIGNRLLLECDEMWKSLIKHYESQNKIVDAATFMRDA